MDDNLKNMNKTTTKQPLNATTSVFSNFKRFYYVLQETNIYLLYKTYTYIWIYISKNLSTLLNLLSKNKVIATSVTYIKNH